MRKLFAFVIVFLLALSALSQSKIGGTAKLGGTTKVGVASGGGGSPAFVNVASGENNSNPISGSTVATGSFSSTTGNVIVVGLTNNAGSTTVVSISDTAGNTYTAVDSLQNVTADSTFRTYYAKNITGNASNVVTATFTNASTVGYARIM